MKTVEMEITPAIAAEFLKSNSINRAIRPSWVKSLKTAIERGEWLVSHQGIAFSSDKTLIDGQHRLHAIIAAGIPVNMLVSFDCNPNSYIVLDGGVKRSTADLLGIPRATATVARMIWKLPNRTNASVPSAMQVSSVLDWSRDVISMVTEVPGLRTKFASSAIEVPLVIHLMAGHDEVLETYSAFKLLAFDAMHPSVQALSKQMIEGKAGAQRNYWDLVARAWRAFDPANWANTRIIIKDVDFVIDEMVATIDRYRNFRQPTATKSGKVRADKIAQSRFRAFDGVSP